MDVELVNDGPVTICSTCRLGALMPPEDRFVCRFAAEPPQGPLPYGRWAETLQAEFLAACLKIDSEGEDLGEAGELTYYPDRTWAGRTYVPVSTRSSTGFELYGYVSFTPGDEHDEPSDFYGWADFTDVTADDTRTGGWTSPRRSSAAGAASRARWPR